MAHLEEYIENVFNELKESGASTIANAKEIKKAFEAIDTENAAIQEDYTKIGEAYCRIHGDETEGELGEMVQKVKASEKAIKDNKMKIGSLMGLTFCESCGEQVDEDDLYCNNCGAKMPVKVLPGMVLCPHCNKAVKEGIRFCSNCGKPMEEEEKPPVKVCPGCGFTTEDMSKDFCDKCNRRLVAEGVDPEEEEKPEDKVPTHKVCPACGFKIFDADTMFCEKCNRRLVEESELEQ